MRSIIAGSSLGFVLLVAGCNILPPRPGPGPRPMSANSPTPKVEDLISYLNANADKIAETDALQCTKLAISCQAGRQNVGLSGMMVCQKPRNFRLTGKVIGQPAVDIGSNRDEFWYWISKNDPPYLFHCSYDALARGAKVGFPFQPDMVVSALGLEHYDPAHSYQLNAPRNAKYFELIENTKSPQGEPIQKIVVFARETATLPDPQVIAYALRDAKGKDICIANISRVTREQQKGAVLPTKVTFKWPAMNLTMTMEMNDLQIVPVNNEMANRFFSRQRLDYQAFDLATRSLDGPGLQRAGATAPIRTR